MRKKIINEELKIYPVTAKDQIEISMFNVEGIKEFHSLSNNLGSLIQEEELRIENGLIKITTSDLPSDVYSLQLKNRFNETVSKRFVISW